MKEFIELERQQLLLYLYSRNRFNSKDCNWMRSLLNSTIFIPKCLIYIRMVISPNKDLYRFHHHEITFLSLKKSPVKSCETSDESHTGVSAPFSTERVAPAPPRSVRTHPGQTAFTEIFLPLSS